MTKHFKPMTTILKVGLLLIFSLIIPTIAGVYLSIKEINDPVMINIVNGCAMLFGFFLLQLFIKKSPFRIKEVGFQKGSIGIWIYPLLLIELIPFISGIQREISIEYIVTLFFFMGCVGFFEESLFRGLIFQYLKTFNVKIAIWGSAVLFGIGHAANLLSGESMVMTVSQIVFAFLFGFVAAEIVALTKSLQWVIVWHVMHNVIDQVTTDTHHMPILFIQCLILLMIALFMWRRMNIRT
ncbi:CPBP family intramembrane glutamic endopeptidase [Bacillus sp. NPDC077027]|uniref:CPBP family intramembrane glutamic endopeptidase n=1 Tax=Bacillus sp. NPDC077027 TaxID=3390548 RepID=UPI003D054765